MPIFASTFQPQFELPRRFAFLIAAKVLTLYLSSHFRGHLLVLSRVTPAFLT